MRIEQGTTWLADGYTTKLFATEQIKETPIKPREKDNFILHPKDEIATYKEFQIGSSPESVWRSSTPQKRRAKSASSVRLQDRPWRQSLPKYPQGYVPRSRPASAVPQRAGPPSGATANQRRVKSAGSARSRAHAEAKAQAALDNLRKGFTLVNKLYENSYSPVSLNLHPASPAPDYRYFDRHSRCHDHTHSHIGWTNERPQRACEKYLESCSARAGSPTRFDDPHCQPRRYIDYHRPRTAPGTRRELQYIPRPSYVFRGHVPHFCNFVHKLHLHSKNVGSSDSMGMPDSELGDEIDLVAESVDGSLIGQWRKTSNASSIPEQKEDIMGSGIEGRPGSPSSVDGVEKVEEEEEANSQPVTGIEIRITPSLHSNSSDKVSKQGASKDSKHSKGNASQGIPEEDPDALSPPKTPADAWNEDYGKSSTLSLGKIPTSGIDSDENNNREPSPRQPPPSPEPIPLPTAPKTPPPSKKRSCINKKTKKPVDRARKMKEIELPKEPDPPKEELEAIPPLESESAEKEAKLDIQIPELPSPAEKKPREKSEKAKPHRHLIEVQDDYDLFKPDPTDLLNDQMKKNRNEIDWSAMDLNGTDDIKRPPQIKSWIQGRLALSQQSSRFELPMDMKLLETMSPVDYIKKYCIITSRRQNLYQKIFLKNKDKSGQILYKDIDKTLKDVLVNTITSEQIQYLLDLLDITEETKVDYKLFAGMAAYAERVLYPKYVTEDTIDMPEYQKEKIECADFCALDWKFHGVNVNPKMKTLLMEIR